MLKHRISKIALLKFLVFTAPLLFITNAYTQTSYEFIGLVENNTKTLTGDRFYRLFAKQWFHQSIANIVNIQITEKIYYGSSSMLIIHFKDRIVTTENLQRNSRIDRAFIQKVIANTSNNIALLLNNKTAI